MLWENVLYETNQKAAKAIQVKIDSLRVLHKRVDWQKVCKVLDYPFDNAFNHKNEINSHFRRVLIEIKILSVTGQITWQHFKGVKSNRVY